MRMDGVSVPAPIAGTTLPSRVRAEDVPKHGFQVALLSGVDRKGAWTPARRTTTIAIMGGAGLDLREARFGPGVTEIRIIAIMGGKFPHFMTSIPGGTAWVPTEEKLDEEVLSRGWENPYIRWAIRSSTSNAILRSGDLIISGGNMRRE